MNKLIQIITLVGMTVLLQAPLASATSIDLVVNSPVGLLQDVDIVVSGLPTGEIVSAFDLDVLYNPLEVQPVVDGVTGNYVDFGPWLGDPLLLEALTDSCPGPCNLGFNTPISGVVDLAEVSLLLNADLVALQSGLGGSFTLATLNFQYIPDDGGLPGYALSWTAGNDVKGLDPSVPIYPENPIPEPSTVLLITSGLLGLAAFRRRFGK